MSIDTLASSPESKLVKNRAGSKPKDQSHVADAAAEQVVLVAGSAEAAHAKAHATAMLDALHAQGNAAHLGAGIEAGAPTAVESEVVRIIPGTLKVIKRSGKVAAFDTERIKVALKKAFLEVKGKQAARSSAINQQVETLAEEVCEVLRSRLHINGHVQIESIQDQVELALMRAQEHQVCRAYVVYRDQRAKERQAQAALEAQQAGIPADEITQLAAKIEIKDVAGKLQPLPIVQLREQMHKLATKLLGVDAERILKDALRNMYHGMEAEDVQQALIMSARAAVEQNVNYSYLTARLLMQKLYHEGLSFLEVEHDFYQPDMQVSYPQAFKAFIKQGIELEYLDPELASYDLDVLAQALDAERDQQFTYLSIQTLYDRYFIHHQGQRMELPQIFYMRVAMGVAKSEPHDREQWAIKFYRLFSSFDYMPSTPTLFNAGTCRPQLSSCFLTTIPDDLEGIYGAIRDNALLSKYAGGLGNDWTPVRSLGAHIKGTNGHSLGVVPFLNVADATAVAVNQGGKRKGAVCAYLELWHMDVEEFLELRKNTGDERRRTHDMNTANWIPDLFMKRVFENGEWTLFSPNQAPELHDLYGQAFEAAYVQREEQAQAGMIRSKTIKAKKLWRKMLGLLFETGHPWITFKDACNIRSPQQHVGVVHSSNLCTEITLNTSQDEIAVCNLGSINLVQHLLSKEAAAGLEADEFRIDHKKLARTAKLAMRVLDNVIDNNFYTVPQAKNANLKHRPVGLGAMGFQDALYELRIPYDSDKAVEFADRYAEHISYHAISASSDLAAERGSYESYQGSLWDQGILPIDSIKLLAQSRGTYLEQDQSKTLDWDALRKKVKKQGMRNSNTMAIAPTATIANICGVSQSIEPTYQNLFVKSNMSGEFTVINPYLARDLERLGLWDDVMVHDLKYYNGSVQSIARVPADLKALYKTSFEIDTKWLVDAASRRQKWIDQSQSLNLYMAEPSGKKLDALYRLAWLRGLKCTYYLRTMGATHVEKSTIQDGALNSVSGKPAAAMPAACSILDPDCDACQ